MTAIARQVRLIAFSILLGSFVIAYLVNGAMHTRQSEFYVKTLALMDSKAQELPQEQKRSSVDPSRPELGTFATTTPSDPYHKAFDQAVQARTHQKPAQAPRKALFEPDENLRERLKVAEQEAKKSADAKYRGMADIERAIEANKELKRGYATKSPSEENSVASSIVPDEHTKSSKSGSPKGKNTKGTARKTKSAKAAAARKKLSAAAAAASAASSTPEAGKVLDTPRESDKTPDTAPLPEKKPAQQPLEDHKPTSSDPSLELAKLLARSPITIFSKSYCPYSQKAKFILLDAMKIKPSPYVVELDRHPLGPELQELLKVRTGRRTVPNIVINGKSIGGGDDIEEFYRSGTLKKTLVDSGAGKIEEVEELIKPAKEAL